MNFELDDPTSFSNDIRSLQSDLNGIEHRRRQYDRPENAEEIARLRLQRLSDQINEGNRQADRYEGGIIPALNGIIPLSIEGIDERDIYTRFTSSELARYTINLLKERIHLLRLIFTIFVLVFTNWTNLLILLPNKNIHEYSFWENTLTYIIYLTPFVQFIWFVLLIMGRNNTKYYISLKFAIIGLTSVTSIIAYFGVLVDDIFQKWDSHIVFFICMANISAMLLWCFFVLFSIGLILVASIITSCFGLMMLPFLIIYLIFKFLINTFREVMINISLCQMRNTVCHENDTLMRRMTK